MSAMRGIRMKNPAHPGGFIKSEIVIRRMSSTPIGVLTA